MDNENKKITPERLYNLSERALNIGDWEYQAMILKERIDSFHEDDREEFDRVSHCIERELSRKPKKVKKKEEEPCPEPERPGGLSRRYRPAGGSGEESGVLQLAYRRLSRGR